MRASLFTALALLLLANVQSARILGLFPHTGKSHQMVFEPLLVKLAERGHDVTVVSFFPLKNPPANYTDISLEGLAGIGLEVIDLGWYEDSNPVLRWLGILHTYQQVTDFVQLGDMATDVCKKIVGFPPLHEALKREYDVILVENFNSDCMLGLAHIYGQKAPTIALLSSNYMPWSAHRIGLTDNPAYLPVITSDLAGSLSFWKRLENTFVQTLLKIWYRNSIQIKEQEIIERHFGRRITDLEDLGKNTTAMFINTFHALNGVRPSLPAAVEVGGMHLNPQQKPIPAYMERFLNESEHGVVLFSFGSLLRTSTMPKHKQDMFIKVLSELKQRVIWKYEDSGEEGTRIGNILRVKWLPQYELLRHHKVIAFIAHGGLLGMTEAVSAGKPMLVIPFFGDQPLNGAAAQAAGMARMVYYLDINEDNFREALHEVISAEMRINARRVSQMWHDRQASPLDTAVYWTERVIRWGHQAPLHSPARDLSLIQLSLIDVAATFLLIVVVLLITAYAILSFISKLISASLTKEKKKIH